MAATAAGALGMHASVRGAPMHAPKRRGAAPHDGAAAPARAKLSQRTHRGHRMPHRRRTLGAIIALAASLAGTHVHAAVRESDAGHFLLAYSLPVKATPQKAYAATIGIARWWSSDHTYSGSAKNLHLDARAGGCWCETLKGGGVEHMRVVLAMPAQMLRLKGGLGPLQAGAVDATLTFEFKAGKDGNVVAVSYVAAGYFSGGLDKVAAGVDQVLGLQLQRLAAVIDGADPDAAAAAGPKSG